MSLYDTATSCKKSTYIHYLLIKVEKPHFGIFWFRNLKSFFPKYSLFKSILSFYATLTLCKKSEMFWATIFVKLEKLHFEHLFIQKPLNTIFPKTNIFFRFWNFVFWLFHAKKKNNVARCCCHSRWFFCFLGLFVFFHKTWKTSVWAHFGPHQA